MHIHKIYKIIVCRIIQVYVIIIKDVSHVQLPQRKFGNVFNTYTSNKLYTYESCVNMNKISFLFNSTFLFILFVIFIIKN